MTVLDELVAYCDRLLEVERFQDYCPNGLQVEGKNEVTRIVTGVTASQALLDAAVSAKADLLLVHHGYFWKGENPCLTGLKQRRLKTLLQHEMSLLAYHLPLDAHPALGNNAQLAKRLGLVTESVFGNGHGVEIACLGRLEKPLSAAEFARSIGEALDRQPQHISGRTEKIQRVAWCTGAAQSYFEAAVERGVDAFISGEISEPTVHIARESGVHYFAAGHHATERDGVQALGEHLASQFALEHRYIEIDNPV